MIRVRPTNRRAERCLRAHLADARVQYVEHETELTSRPGSGLSYFDVPPEGKRVLTELRENGLEIDGETT